MKRLTILTILFNFFIVVGAGHGIGFVGIIEMALLNYLTSDFTLSPFADYDASLPAVGLLALIGQITLIISLATKNYRFNYWLKLLGLFLLWLSFYYLTHTLFTSGLARISFAFGLPFLLCSILLFIKIIRERQLKEKELNQT
ncbi:hypothetical protein [Rufibacter latericius]|uniref:DUF4293 family protein n=1 Tax=Rufibacter latericius TaxID=2487040 RepID=A0A3M9MC49_9BACT|nr:hypothetical protein [Rufibacter latericius]RNI23116.1 hypothetical protein EFB08_19555 [Rufibacter latericius]